MGEHVKLVIAKIRDYSDSLRVPPNVTELDIKKVVRRQACEGAFFLTRTLPSFGKDFLTSVEIGSCSSADLFPGFTRIGRAGGPPKFLRGFFELIFSRNGELLPTPNVDAAAAIHDICQTFSKLEGAAKDETVQEQYTTFVGTDNTLRVGKWDLFLQARMALGDLFRDFKIDHCHEYSVGSGSSFGGLSTANKKWTELFHRRWQLPASRYVSESRFLCDPESGEFVCRRDITWDAGERASSVQRLPIKSAKLTDVAKDARGARLISVEPVEHMWIQQGQARLIREWVEKHAFTKGHLSFSDQTINASMAVEGSRTGKWATLDLKDASDRVSLDLVETIWPARISNWLKTSRTEYFTMPATRWIDVVETQPPVGWVKPEGLGLDRSKCEFNAIDGKAMPKTGLYIPVWKYKKFAPMGSAVCFPVMALTIWAIVTAELSRKHERTVRDFYIYGDDLIVDVDDVKDVRAALEACGLMLSDKKCFQGTKSLRFREACGSDSFNGKPVRVHRIKKDLISENNLHSEDASVGISSETLASWFRYEAAADEACMYHFAAAVRDELEKALGEDLRFVYKNLPGTPFSFRRINEPNASLATVPHNRLRWNKKLQRVEVLTFVGYTSATSVLDEDGDLNHLLRSYVKFEEVALFADLVSRGLEELHEGMVIQHAHDLWLQTMHEILKGARTELFPASKPDDCGMRVRTQRLRRSFQRRLSFVPLY